MRDIPLLLNHSRDMGDVLGYIRIQRKFAKKLAEGLLNFDVSTSRAFGLPLHVQEVSLVPQSAEDEFARQDEKIRAFFKEARELVKDEVGEGDNVFPVILNKLRLLAEWRRLKAEEECPHLSRTLFVGCGDWAYWVCDECEEIVGKKHKADEEDGGS